MAYVEDLGNNKHKIYVDMGYVRGKRVRRTKTVTVTSNRDLNNKIRDFELKCLQEQDEPIDNITFANFADKWWENHVLVNLTLNTKETYERALKKLNNHFSKMKMKDIKTFHVVEYFVKVKEEAGLPNHYVVLKSIFTKAVEWDVIKDNPTKGIKQPEPKNKRQIDFYNESEIKHLLSVLDNVYPKHRIMIKLAVIGGLRISEVAGVTEESINYKENYILVDKQLSYSKDTANFFLSPTKNKKPRKVFFPTEFMKELKAYVTDLKKRKMAMGSFWKPLKVDGKTYNLIIVKENGYPSHVDSIGNEWRKIIKRNKLKSISFHQLRHSCASLMVKKGINFKVIQERLGHANIGITIDLYSHLEVDLHKESTNVFDNIL